MCLHMYVYVLLYIVLCTLRKSSQNKPVQPDVTTCVVYSNLNECFSTSTWRTGNWKRLLLSPGNRVGTALTLELWRHRIHRATTSTRFQLPIPIHISPTAWLASCRLILFVPHQYTCIFCAAAENILHFALVAGSQISTRFFHTVVRSISTLYNC